MLNADECPTSNLHHPDFPAGYIEAIFWARNMRRDHIQKQCPGCKLWRIWEPK